MTFSVHFSLFVKHSKGDACFIRQADLPFVPFPGLDVHDDAVGQFKIRDVAWSAEEEMFFCQSHFDYWDDKSLRTVRQRMKRGGWDDEEIVDEEEV
jgi:hypothetical protein